MKFNLKKELPLILLSVLPSAYLMFLWQSLPAKVPLHWDINGEINRYGDKMELLIIGALPLIMYALFLFIPLIDPKKRFEGMGNKYYTIRLITAVFLAVLFSFIIYSVKEQSLINPNYLFVIIGAFFVLLGNYFKTIKPNYFVGIRTPWTLENEENWKKTHRLGGKFWVGGGLLIIVTSLIFNEQTALIFFYSITAIIVLVPVAYSYLIYRRTVSLIVVLLISTGVFAQKPNRPQTPEAPFDYNIEDVSFTNAKDTVVLAGTFTFPKTGKNFTSVILISGSGPQNRNSEILDHKSFWVLADYLTNNGIAVLRYDDRGVGESTGNFSKATTVDFARDVEAAMAYLKSRKEINPRKMGLIGHSEGGIIAPMVASKNKDVAFVVSMAGVMIPGSDLLLLQKELQLNSMGSSKDYIAKELDFDKGIMKVVTTSEMDSLPVNLEKYTTQYFKDHPKFASEHGLTEEYYKSLIVSTYSNHWLSNFIKYNPMSSLENLRVPMLALNGELDLQVPIKENFEVLETIQKNDPSKDITLKSYPNLNHLFQECKTGSTMEYSQIEQTLSPEILRDITEWIKKQ